jgi:hypothetical protein
VEEAPELDVNKRSCVSVLIRGDRWFYSLTRRLDQEERSPLKES